MYFVTFTDLQETFHNHFASGAAAERYFADADVFNTIVQQAADIEGAQVYGL